MAVKTYIRAVERWPTDTLNYAASTNYFLGLAEALPDFGSYIKTDVEYFNNAVFIVIVYNTI